MYHNHSRSQRFQNLIFQDVPGFQDAQRFQDHPQLFRISMILLRVQGVGPFKSRWNHLSDPHLFSTFNFSLFDPTLSHIFKISSNIFPQTTSWSSLTLSNKLVNSNPWIRVPTGLKNPEIMKKWVSVSPISKSKSYNFKMKQNNSIIIRSFLAIILITMVIKITKNEQSPTYVCPIFAVFLHVSSNVLLVHGRIDDASCFMNDASWTMHHAWYIMRGPPTQ